LLPDPLEAQRVRVNRAAWALLVDLAVRARVLVVKVVVVRVKALPGKVHLAVKSDEKRCFSVRRASGGEVTAAPGPRSSVAQQELAGRTLFS
jgi:hypothetical protein